MKLIIFIGLILICSPCKGSKSIKDIITHKQPNGEIIKYRLFGDEFFSYKKDLDGNYLKNENGYLVPTKEINSNTIREVYNINKNNKIKEYNLLKIANIKLKSTPILPTEYKFPVILVEFIDYKFSNDNILYNVNQLLNSKAVDYLNSNYSNITSFRFSVCPIIITLPKPRSYYGNDSSYEIDVAIREMVETACKTAHDNSFNFADFDIFNNGEIPGVNIIFAGYSQAETGINTDLWPQFFNIQNLNIGGKKILSAACSNELSNLGINKGSMQGIGTFCHEFCHILGIPDMYDTNGIEEGLSKALDGKLSIMDSGNYNDNGNTPPYFTAIEKEIIGFSPIYPIANKNYTAKHHSNGGEFYRINTITENEYFLIEHRSNTNWDKYIDKSGLIIYHIDKSKNSYGNIRCDERWIYNNINAFAEHECAKLFYFGNNLNSFSPTTSLPFIDWSNKPLEINLNNIIYYQDHTLFTTTQGELYDKELNIFNNPIITTYQESCRIKWDPIDKQAEYDGYYIIKLYEYSISNTLKEVLSLNFKYNNIMLNSLLPNTKYLFTISYKHSNFFTLDKSKDFTTSKITSNYPYINVLDNYSTDSEIDLVLLNKPTDGYKNITWKVNEKEVDPIKLLLNNKGTNKIEAIIKYSDNSQEIITKIIEVN